MYIGVRTVIIPCITFSGPTHLVVILSDFFEKKTTMHGLGWYVPIFLPRKFSTIIVFVGGVQYHVQPLVGWCLRWLYYFKSLHEREPLLAEIPKIANHQHQAATNSWLTNWLLHHFVEPFSRLAICASIARQSLTRPFGKSSSGYWTYPPWN